MSPIQLSIATINDKCKDFAYEIEEILKDHNFRCYVDSRNEKLNYKIRESSLQKIPFIIVLGEKEVESKKVMLRELGINNQVLLTIDELIKKLKNSCSIS